MVEPTDWCVLACFEGRSQFILGHVMADSPEAAMKELRDLARELFPTMPEFIHVISGRLVFEAGPYKNSGEQS